MLRWTTYTISPSQSEFWYENRAGVYLYIWYDSISIKIVRQNYSRFKAAYLQCGWYKYIGIFFIFCQIFGIIDDFWLILMAALYELLSLVTHFIDTSQIKDPDFKIFIKKLLTKNLCHFTRLAPFGLVKTGQNFGLYCIGSCTNLGSYSFWWTSANRVAVLFWIISWVCGKLF